MNKKLMKKLVVPVMTAALLISTATTASAYTVSGNVNTRTFVYNGAITLNTNFTNAYKFDYSSFAQRFINTPSSNNINFKYTQAPVDTNNQPEKVTEEPQQQPVEESPQQPEVTPVQPPANNPPAQEPAAPQAPVEQPRENTTPENTSNARHSLTQAEIQMVEYVNQARRDAGLQPLAIDVDLSYVARVKSKDMQDNNYFSHTSPTYGSPFDMMRNFGIQYRRAAENIAINSSVSGAHNAFMNSEGHRNNILNPSFTHIGIGIENRHYTQMFIQK